jgi:hypothetical protein
LQKKLAMLDDTPVWISTDLPWASLEGHTGLMLEQDKTNKARMIGYAIGIAIFAIVAICKFVVR